MPRTSEKTLSPLRLLILFVLGIGILAIVVFGEAQKYNDRFVVMQKIREQGGSVILGEPNTEQSPWQIRYWIQAFAEDNNVLAVRSVQTQLQSEEDLIRILALDEMVSLTLTGNLNPTLVSKLPKLPFLESLSVHSSTIDALTVEGLAGISSLKRLGLRGCNLTVPLLEALANLPLELSLSFESQPISNEILIALSKTNNLRSLQFDQCNLDNSSRQLLGGSNSTVDFTLNDSQVTTLGLARFLPVNKHWTVELHCQDAARADSTTPNRFPSADLLATQTRLGFSGSCIDDSLFECIESAKNLQTLGIGNCSISDKGMARLKEFSELRQLSIASKDLTDAGLAPVQYLSKLEQLFLNASAVNGSLLALLPESIRSLHLRTPSAEPSSVGGLARLQRLEELTLEGRNFSDASLDLLSGFPALQSLTLYDTSITKEAVERFKRRFPVCRITDE